ncbi:GumC family protein [Methylobacterium sp. sgz302541]|uniref:GumC family protein n=1 Tax=unclassified Methylobacterium TaxID=2615210 RepID=UPI003D33C746
MTQIDRPIAVANWMEPPGAEPFHSGSTDTTADVADLGRILLRRRALILGTAALLGLLATLYAVLTPSLYTAVSQILVDPRDRQVVTNDVNPGALSPDGGVTQVESQVRVIESEAVLGRAVAETGLATDPEFGAPADGLVASTVRSLRARLFGDAGAPGVDPQQRALDALRRKLAVKRADKVFVIDVIVTTKNPDKSARIVNAIAKAYLADQTSARAQAADRASGDLRARLDDLRTAVNKADDKLEAFKAENGLISSSGRLVGEQQLTESNARLVAARGRTAEAKARLQGIRDARGRAMSGATPEAIQSTVIERLRSQYAELASKEADLRTNLGERHPFIAATRTQMADVKRLIDAELNRIAEAAQTEYQRAQANEATAAAELERLQKVSAVTAKSTVRLRELEREVEASRAVYNSFLLRSREIKEQAGVDTTNARVISWAQPPQDRSWPPRFFIIMAALASGAGLGVGLALMKEYVEPTVLSRNQLERLSHAPVVAMLPRLRRPADGSSATAASFALDHLSGGRRGAHESRSLSVVVTSGSADAADRRSAIDLLAAVAVARGDRVLVIDADMRGADPRDGGLLDILRGEESLHAVSTQDPVTGARRLGLGRTGKPLRDALQHENVERFLLAVKSRFDLILVNGGTLSENLRIGPIAAAADRLVVVVRNGQTRQRDLLSIVDAAVALARPVSASLLVDGRAAA